MIIDLSKGVSIKEVDSDALDQFEINQSGITEGFVRFLPSGQVLPRCFARFEKEISELEVKPDDIWISSFPKCGTTWLQEMVWNIVNNLDLETARAKSLEERVPFLELTGITEERHVKSIKNPIAGTGLVNSVNQVKNLASPRVIKTHLCYDMLPRKLKESKTIKIIYVARNPRDVVVSYYNHWRMMSGFTGDFETFFNAFVGDVCGYYSPFLKHVLSSWEKSKVEKNILFITFEEMKNDLVDIIKRVSCFLEKDINSEQIAKLADHLSFKNMKKNKAVNKEDVLKMRKNMNGGLDGNFMRKGETGDWKNHLTQEQLKKIKDWEKELLEQSDLQFVYEL